MIIRTLGFQFVVSKISNLSRSGQGPLTAEEEKALSSYFRQRKLKSKKALDKKKRKVTKRSQSAV